MAFVATMTTIFAGFFYADDQRPLHPIHLRRFHERCSGWQGGTGLRKQAREVLVGNAKS